MATNPTKRQWKLPANASAVQVCCVFALITLSALIPACGGGPGGIPQVLGALSGDDEDDREDGDEAGDVDDVDDDDDDGDDDDQNSAPNCGPNGELCVCGTESGVGCAPNTARVDLYEPTFSNPTRIDNPLFSISEIDQTILLGHKDGVPLRVVYTLLPEPRAITWNGRQVDTVQVQYVAFLDRRIVEYALDWYAQADDGSVWYFGEDVFNYEDGVIANTDGTWLVERDGPLAMIMPANPQIGDVYRVENIPGRIFEEVMVVAVDLSLEGPSGTVEGAMHAQQLSVRDTHSFKTFAPGYAEFLTAEAADLEALALAVPTDAVPGPAPVELETVLIGAGDIFEAALSEDCDALATTLDAMNAAWQTYAAADAPPWLATRVVEALASLARAIDLCAPQEVNQAAVDVALAALDVQLRHLPPPEIDHRRFDVWARQLIVDAAAEDVGAVRGDVATLELVRDRFAATVSSDDLSLIDSELEALRAAAQTGDFSAVADVAARLRDVLGR